MLEGEMGLVEVEIKQAHSADRRRLATLREFVRERGCRLSIVFTNDREPRRLDDWIMAIPFSHL